MSSAICFNLDQSKILSFGNGLHVTQNKIVDLSYSKAFADDKSNVVQIVEIKISNFKAV